jgi:hypothetical protein
MQEQFCSDLLKKEIPRGSEASVLLRNAVCEELAVKFPKIARNKYCLVIRIFASLEVLALNTTMDYKTSSIASFFAILEGLAPSLILW